MSPCKSSAREPVNRSTLHVVAAVLLSIIPLWPNATAWSAASAASGVAVDSPLSITTASAESVGFSPDRLARLKAAMQGAVDEGQYAGVVTLLARHGKVVQYTAYGKLDVASGHNMERDSIFRLFSMTKPVTGAAMMMLYEEGKWSPQDRISKFIPEFDHLKVFKGLDESGQIMVEDSLHPPTMRELMSFTAGFGGWGYRPSPIDRFYTDERGRSIYENESLQELIDRLSKIPLLYQPGTRWQYGVSTDIQGHIIEKLSGMTLPVFMKKRLFDPLRMKDTGFYVPLEKRRRFATLYKWADKAGLIAMAEPVLGLTYDKEPAMPVGSGGLVSSAVDFFRFAQMLLNGGELDGVRILSPATVRLMTSNHLPDTLMGDFHGGGDLFKLPRRGLGWGYDGAVVTNPAQADMPVGKDTYFWDGGGGTWFWIDPANDIVFVGLVQRLDWLSDWGVSPNLEELSRALVYQALIKPAS